MQRDNADELLCRLEDKEDVDWIETVIYAMADKFLEKMEMEDIWEMMKMTTLGEILVREGKKEKLVETITEMVKDDFISRLK